MTLMTAHLQMKMITNLAEKRGLILLVGPSIPMKTSSCQRMSPTPCWTIRFRTLFLTRLVLLRTKNSSNRTYFSKTLQFFCRFIHNRKERLVTNVVRRPSTRKPFAGLVNAKEVEDYFAAFVSRIDMEWTFGRRWKIPIGGAHLVSLIVPNLISRKITNWHFFCSRYGLLQLFHLPKQNW